MFYVVVLLQADGDDKNVARLEGGKEFLKQEFVNAAYQSFLAGKDPGLDYAQVLVSYIEWSRLDFLGFKNKMILS